MADHIGKLWLYSAGRAGERQRVAAGAKRLWNRMGPLVPGELLEEKRGNPASPSGLLYDRYAAGELAHRSARGDVIAVADPLALGKCPTHRAWGVEWLRALGLDVLLCDSGLLYSEEPEGFEAAIMARTPAVVKHHAIYWPIGADPLMMEEVATRRNRKEPMWAIRADLRVRKRKPPASEKLEALLAWWQKTGRRLWLLAGAPEIDGIGPLNLRSDNYIRKTDHPTTGRPRKSSVQDLNLLQGRAD